MECSSLTNRSQTKLIFKATWAAIFRKASTYIIPAPKTLPRRNTLAYFVLPLVVKKTYITLSIWHKCFKTFYVVTDGIARKDRVFVTDKFFQD
jgi:hypothetical protein